MALLVGCGGGDKAAADGGDPPPTDAMGDGPGEADAPELDAPPPLPVVIGLDGIAAWDALAPAEQDQLKVLRSFFIHRSVGQDLEDGAWGIGFEFDVQPSGSTNLSAGLNGVLFATPNGDPSQKVAEWRAMALANQATLRLAVMHFSYDDLLDDGLIAAAEADYVAAVADLEAAGIRVLHLTPPLVYNEPADNVFKLQMREWMLATFPEDVIFDFTDVESINPADGARCERGGSWEICDAVRSTVGCPSYNQGIDGPSGMGHICWDPHAKRFARALLYSMYLAAR